MKREDKEMGRFEDPDSTHATEVQHAQDVQDNVGHQAAPLDSERIAESAVTMMSDGRSLQLSVPESKSVVLRFSSSAVAMRRLAAIREFVAALARSVAPQGDEERSDT